MSGFWQQLTLPIIGLSPMDGVTDHPMRHITKKYGKPMVLFTEFTSVEGVCHGATDLLTDFVYDETQRPIVAQIYGTTPDYFRQTSILICELGFDGIDINMGCPAKNVAHSGAGAALINTPKLAQEIIKAVQQGINDWHNGAAAIDCTNITQEMRQQVSQRQATLPIKYSDRTRQIPVSVKTRIGYSKPVVADWIPVLLETGVSVVSLHGRTLKQQYGGEANWDEISKASELAHQTTTLLLGNGDIKHYSDALDKVATYRTDGALIGRSAMGNPYVFSALPPASPSRFNIALEHAQLYQQTYSDSPRYNFLPMRKHLGWYVREIPFASDIRIELFQTNSANEVRQVLSNYRLLEE